MKYSDLVNARKENESKWNRYRTDLYEAFRLIIMHLANYLEIPSKELISFVPIDKEKRKKDERYFIEGAIAFEVDGWSSMGVILELQPDEKILAPRHRYLFHFRLKKIEKQWHIKLFDDGEIYTVTDLESTEEIESVFKEFTLTVQEWLKNSLENWLSGDNKSNRIGFEI